MTKIPVFILSDFGSGDTYVAQMKAAVLSFAGYDTQIVDLTNEVEAGNVLQGAFHLRAALPFLPEGSVTLAVVDPGVGSARAGLAACWRGRYLVAPDNGLVSLLTPPLSLWRLPGPDSGVSSTFHGRDWFAPCAARLAVDPGWTEFLDPLENPIVLPRPGKTSGPDRVSSTVLHVDRFGNCILDVGTENGIPFSSGSISVPAGGFPLRRVDHYGMGKGEEVLLIAGSLGFMELAVRNGSAASLLGLEQGMNVILFPDREE